MSCFRIFTLAGLLCAASACSQGASSSASTGGDHATQAPTQASSGSLRDWAENGASACDRYLTPDVVGRIFKEAVGSTKRLSSQACSFKGPPGSYSHIGITLIDGGISTFETDPATAGGTPLQGIGDKAVSTLAGIEAVKDHVGICHISVVGEHTAATAQELGAVCNKLFALP